MKFIHIADVHLGVKPHKDKPWAKEREEHSWQAFRDVITKAKDEQVQLLLIAGNLFHRQPLIRELKEVSQQFSRIPKTQVVLITGDCDYLGPNSCYQVFTWGENVHFLKEKKISYIELEELRVRVYGLSYWRREMVRNQYDNLQVKKDGYCNVLLARGGDRDYTFFQSAKWKNSVFDYMALGYDHKPMQMNEHKMVISGALQPIDYRETGEHGYFMGELGEDGCKADFYPIQYCQYVSMELKVNQDTKEGELKRIVSEQIEKAPAFHFFKIILTGVCPSDFTIDTEDLAGMERVAQVVNRCQPDYDFEKLKLRYRQQILGRYIEALEKMPQNEITKKALCYGVEALLAE